MIKLKNIEKSFGENKIYNNFSLNFKEKQVNCILGKSGCGKSTLLKIISGLESINKGEVLNVPNRISYIFQEDRLIEWKNIYENLELPIINLYKKHEREEKIKEILKLFSLEETIYSYPKSLSGGMRQRINIARAFIYRGELLLMDEPFKSLDKGSKDNIVRFFRAYREKNKTTVIMVTHDIDEALSLGDNIFVLGDKPIRVLEEFEVKKYIEKPLDLEKRITEILRR